MPSDHHDDTPIDLRAIDPGSLDRNDDEVVAIVMRRVRALPSGPAAHIDPLWGLWSMSRGLAVAGALLVLLMVAYDRPWQHATPGPATVAESLGVPPEFLDLLAREGGRQ